MPLNTCKTCGHNNSWHLHSDGPLPRICNTPKCTCTEYVEETLDLPLAG